HATTRWNVVDCGSTIAITAMRARNQSCSATKETMTSSAQRRTLRPRDVVTPARDAASRRRDPRAQRAQHRRRLGLDAAPEEERLGRLLDQHAEPVAAGRAMRLGP